MHVLRHSTWWVQCSTSAIDADANTVIYMNFMPGNIMTSNTAYTGEAPELYRGSYAQPGYAQYDNGAKVFNFYDDFAGSTLKSSWTVPSGSSTAAVSNGLTISYSTATWADMYNSYASGLPAIFESYMSFVGNGNGGISINTASTSIGSGEADFIFEGVPVQCSIDPASTNYIVGIYTQSTYYIATLAIPSSTSETAYLNYASILSASDTSTISASHPGFDLYGFEGTSTITAKWIRSRSLPPNNLMPSVSFSAPQ